MVLGAPGITADMIADTSSTCDWLNHIYGLDMSQAGAQAYLNPLLDQYAFWCVDFIKVDDETPVSSADNVKQNANMWRMEDDFWDPGSISYLKPIIYTTS